MLRKLLRSLPKKAPQGPIEVVAPPHNTVAPKLASMLRGGGLDPINLLKKVEKALEMDFWLDSSVPQTSNTAI